MGRIDHSRPYILILKEDKGLRGSPCAQCALGGEKQDWNCWEGCQAAAKRIGADPWYSYYIVHYLDYPGDTEPEMERRMVCGDTERGTKWEQMGTDWEQMGTNGNKWEQMGTNGNRLGTDWNRTGNKKNEK